MLFDNLASALPLIKANEVTALGVTTLKRSPSAPDIPSLAEQGLKGFEAVSWFSLMAPAKLPKDIQTRLNQLTIQTLSKPEIRSRLLSGGLEPNPASPEDLARYIQLEAAKWRKIVQQSGAKEQ
jgi:tripartite-type tricarboxylate transporter receptor subunit TctC